MCIMTTSSTAAEADAASNTAPMHGGAGGSAPLTKQTYAVHHHHHHHATYHHARDDSDGDASGDEGSDVGSAATAHADVHSAERTQGAATVVLTPRTRSRFTVSYARGGPATLEAAAAAAATMSSPPLRRSGRADVAVQAAAVCAHRRAEQQRWVDECEVATRVSASDARIAVKMLLRCAAKRDLDLATRAGYAPIVVAFMRQVWRTYVQEADALLDASAAAQCGDDRGGDAAAGDGDDESRDGGADGATMSSVTSADVAARSCDGAGAKHTRCADGHVRQAPTDTKDAMARVRYDCSAALENVSSAGLWYSGPSMSMPLRRYAVQTLAADGVVHNAVLVGYAHFTYSSYVVQLRSASQLAVLAELQRVSEQLHTRCLFVPRLIVAPSPVGVSL